MGAGCPVCNGLTQLTQNCPGCGIQMIDYGGLESYCDPYGPYEEQAEDINREKAVTGDDQCVHLLQCPQCNESMAYPVEQEVL